MGHVWVEVKLRNPWKKLEWRGLVLVDTGATRTALPVDIARVLELEKIRDVEVSTASGTERGWLAYVEVELEGDRTIDRAIVLEKLRHVLTLESLDLKLDPRTGRLERAEILVLATSHG